MGQWLTLHNPSTAQGHWYWHQFLFLPPAAPEHRQQNPYRTQPERLGAQGFPQPAPPALPPAEGQETLLQGPPLDMATTVHQEGSSNADGAEPQRINCGVVAWTAACRHLARDTAGIRQYRPADRMALASTVAAVTMGPSAPATPRPLPGHAALPTSRNAHANGTPHGGTAVRLRRGATGGRRGEFCPPPQPGADRAQPTRAAARCAPPVARHTPRVHPRQGRGWWRTPPETPEGAGTGATGGGLPGHPARPRRGVPVAHPSRGPFNRLARHRQAEGIPAPFQLAAGAHTGLLCDGGPLGASRPATHHQRPKQTAGARLAHTILGP